VRVVREERVLWITGSAFSEKLSFEFATLENSGTIREDHGWISLLIRMQNESALDKMMKFYFDEARVTAPKWSCVAFSLFFSRVLSRLVVHAFRFGDRESRARFKTSTLHRNVILYWFYLTIFTIIAFVQNVLFR